MRTQFFWSIILFTFFSGFSQSAIRVSYETQTIHTEESLKAIPAHIRATVLQQLNSIKKESYMIVHNNIVYFEFKSQHINKKHNGDINSGDKSSNSSIAKDLSLSASYPDVKVIKDFKKKMITTKSDDKSITEKLVTVNWNITKKQIKVLGYSCYEANTTFKNKLLTVYFTNGIGTSASPSNLPFINGVVLAYKQGNTTTMAKKIEFNQPDIKDFFK